MNKVIYEGNFYNYIIEKFLVDEEEIKVQYPYKMNLLYGSKIVEIIDTNNLRIISLDY